MIKDLTYALVDELKIVRSEAIDRRSNGEDEGFEVLIGNVLKPFVEVGTAFCVKRRHDLQRCKESDVKRKTVDLGVGLNRNL